MLNPYSDQNFFSFFWVLLQRIFTREGPLVSDEIQLIVLSCVAISSALVGTFLVLRRMTMLANALSHTILLGIVSLFLLMKLFFHEEGSHQLLSIPVLLLASFVTGIVTTFLTEFLTRVVKLQEDASVGLVFSILFALGIVLVTLFTRNVHIGTELVMGNVDALQLADMHTVLILLGLNLTLFFLFYRGYKITTFDPQLAKTFGFSPLLFSYLLMIQTSASAIGAFRAVGVVMVLAFLVLPVLTARLLTHRLSILIVLAIAIGVISSLFGVALSRHILTYYGVGLSTAGIVVTILGIFFFTATAVRQLTIRSSRDMILPT